MSVGVYLTVWQQAEEDPTIPQPKVLHTFSKTLSFSVFNIVSQSKCSSFVLKPQRADINLDSLGGRMTSRLCCQGNRKCDQVLPLSLNFTFQCLGETKAEDYSVGRLILWSCDCCVVCECKRMTWNVILEQYKFTWDKIFMVKSK